VEASWVHHQSAHLRLSEVGTGSPVLFIHAGVADRRSWHEVMAIVGQSRRALAYDRRGHGDSTHQPESHSPVGDLLAVLADRGIDRVVLVGCSNGGQIAFEAAIRHPDRVSALVLVDSAPLGAPAAEFGQATDTLFSAIDHAEETGDVELVNQLEARLWLDGPEGPEGRVAGAARELFLDMNARALAAGPIGDEAPLTAAWDQLVDLKMPTLVVVGALDLPHLVDRAKQMAAIIPDSKLVTVDAAAHLPMVERPALVAATLLEFIDGIDG
jgi:pimeloyl-ACP methyl ester carboxylesterase